MQSSKLRRWVMEMLNDFAAGDVIIVPFQGRTIIPKEWVELGDVIPRLLKDDGDYRACT